MDPTLRPIDDPDSAFLEAALSPREAHNSGSLDEAQAILARYPQAGTSSIYAAAVLADEAAVRAFLARDRGSATAKGGPRGWDARWIGRKSSARWQPPSLS